MFVKSIWKHGTYKYLQAFNLMDLVLSSQNDNIKKKAAATAPCPIPSSRGTSGLLQIAKLLENRGVCGIPTDTVYALAASCKNPSAIEKIYNIKVSTIPKWCAEIFQKNEYCTSSVQKLFSTGTSCREAHLYLHL